MENKVKATKIRNAYQKIKAGDSVFVNSYPRPIQVAVTKKIGLGFLEGTKEDGSLCMITGCDVVGIVRNGKEVF